MQPFYKAAGIGSGGDDDTASFWTATLRVADRCSADMLSINRHPAMFARLVHELISYSAAAKPPPTPSRYRCNKNHTPLPLACRRAESLSSVSDDRQPITALLLLSLLHIVTRTQHTAFEKAVLATATTN